MTRRSTRTSEPKAADRLQDADPRRLRAPRRIVAGLLFWTLFYLCLWRWVDLRLISSAGNITNFPVFYKGWPFLRESLALPGGLVDYLSALLSQFFYFSWAGALLVTVQAWAICLCTGYILTAAAGRGLRWLRFVPPLLVLLTHAQYSYHFRSIMALLAALAATCAYLGLAPKIGTNRQERDIRAGNAVPHIVLFTGLSLVLYAVAAGAYWLFAALCILHEGLRKRRRPVAALCAVLAVAVVYGEGSLLFGAGALDAYTPLLPLSWEMKGATAERMIAAVYGLYLLLPVAIILWHVLHVPLGAVAGRFAIRPTLRTALGSLALLAAGAAVAVGFHNAEERTRLAVHYYACRRMWPQVLQAAGRHPTTDRAVVNAVDRALYHTGRLGDDVFRYPQQADALLLTGDDRALHYWHKFDTLTDLGLLNLAEKNLTECVAIFGAQPLLLQRLASINVAKGRIGAARVYLHRLTQTLFHDEWARDMLTRLDSEPDATGDSRIRHLRSVRLEQDSITAFYAREPMLQALLETDKHNRMAFEYLMTSNLRGFVTARNFGAPE